MSSPPASALADLRVLEVAGATSGAITGLWFAQLGAQVRRLESDKKSANEASPLHTGKQRIGWDSSHEEALFTELANTDLVIESAAPGPLSPRVTAVQAGKAIRVHISPFDPESALSHWRSNDFIDEALAGHLILNGEPGKKPFARPGRLSSHQAALNAFIGAICLIESGKKQNDRLVRVNHHDGLVCLHQHTLTMWTHGHYIAERSGNRQDGYWHPMGIYPAQDGHIVLCASGQSARDRLLAAIDRPELILDPRFENDLALGRHKDAFDDQIRPWLLSRDRAEIVGHLQAAGVATSSVQNPEEVFKDPHLGARQFWKQKNNQIFPKLPFRMKTRDQSDGPTQTIRNQESTRGAQPSLSMSRKPRVLEFGRVWAGPLTGRILGDLGADVVAIERPTSRGGRSVPEGLAEATHLFPDNATGSEPWNRIGSVNALSRGKRSVAMDPDHPRWLAMIHRLIAEADILVENCAPGHWSDQVLGRETLKALNPDLIVVSISGYGASGPDQHHTAFGPNIEGRCGVAYLNGELQSGPTRSGISWPDPVSALSAVAGTLSAMHQRRHQPDRPVDHVDVSMLESALWIQPDYGLNEEIQGSGDGLEPIPHGIYPCSGDNRWIAISIESDHAWENLCRVLHFEEEWRIWKQSERRLRRELIDQAIAERTRKQDRMILSNTLQSQAVMAGWLSDARDVAESQELCARGFWIDRIDPDGLKRNTPGLPIVLEKHDVSKSHRSPSLGEHNQEILMEWLSMPREEIDALEQIGLLVCYPPE